MTIDQNGDENRPLTFAQKLKEHNRFLKETCQKFEEINLQMSKAKKDGDREEYERLIAQGEEIIKSSDKNTREFETEHEKELRSLAQ